MATICDLSLGKKKPIITYPCNWEYKVIVSYEKDIHIPLQDVLKGKEYKVKKSNDSKNGTYTSHNVTILVTSDDEREAIFANQKTHESVKYVL